MRFAPFIAAILGAFASPVLAQSPEADTCNVSSARPTTIAELHTDPDLRRACVSVEGILKGNTLFADRTAMALPAEPVDADGGDMPETVAADSMQAIVPNRINLQRSRMPKVNGPTWVRIIGTADNCRAIYDEARERSEADGGVGIVFIGGTCHYHYEPYVTPVSLVILEFAPVARFSRSELEMPPLNQAPLRLLEVAPADIPFKFDLRVGPAMLKAIADRDENAFHLLQNFTKRPADFAVRDDLSVAGTWQGSRAQWRTDKDWANALSARRLVQRTDYGANADKLFTLPISDEYEIGLVIACWCITEDCEGKWPALLDEADLGERLPYICLWLNSERANGKQQTYTRVPDVSG